MKFRTTIFLAIILAGLCGAFLFTRYRTRSHETIIQQQKDFVATFFPSDITNITIVEPQRTIQLEKRDVGWVIRSDGDVLADAAKIQTVLNLVNDARIESIVERSSQRAANYGVDASQRIVITFMRQENVIVEVNIGKNGSIPLTMYAMRKDDDRVYLISGSRSSVTGEWKQKEENITNTATL